MWRDEAKRKKRKEFMDVNNSVVTARGGWWVEGGQGVGVINGDGKNTIKIM